MHTSDIKELFSRKALGSEMVEDLKATTERAMSAQPLMLNTWLHGYSHSGITTTPKQRSLALFDSYIECHS